MPEPLKIRVLNDDGTPIVGATVTVGETGYSKVTDSDGTCAFPELEAVLPIVAVISTETPDGNLTFKVAKLVSGELQIIYPRTGFDDGLIS